MIWHTEYLVQLRFSSEKVSIKLRCSAQWALLKAGNNVVKFSRQRMCLFTYNFLQIIACVHNIAFSAYFSSVTGIECFSEKFLSVQFRSVNIFSSLFIGHKGHQSTVISSGWTVLRTGKSKKFISLHYFSIVPAKFNSANILYGYVCGM